MKPHGLLAVIALVAALLAATRNLKRCAVAMFVAALGAAVSYLAIKTLSTPPGLAGSDLLEAALDDVPGHRWALNERDALKGW